MRQTLVVVENPANWPLDIPDVELVSARQYLSDVRLSRLPRARVFNLCRSYSYQRIGYYVSLLAEARGHRAIPSVTTIQDLKSPSIFRSISDDIDEQIQSSLRSLHSDTFVLSIYFGRNMAKRYDRLSWKLFQLFEAPLLRVRFRRTDEWHVQDISAVAVSEIPQDHRPFIIEAAGSYLKRDRTPRRSRRSYRWNMAILRDSTNTQSASNEKAIRKFVAAAHRHGIDAEVIGRDDYIRVNEFDALFIRDTTNVNHYTYRFARKAAAEGLEVIDDPGSILRCTNKVYLAELLERHKIPTPKTVVVNRHNGAAASEYLGLPCIVKQPDSSFSQGVIRADTNDELSKLVDRMLETSELVIAQEFVPTAFDWRIGVLGGKPLYACRYFMASGHWQIIRHLSDGRTRVGKVEAVPLDEVPALVLKRATQAASLIGNGLYGVDLKQSGRRVLVMEINDNPSIDSGFEDAYLKEELYDRVMEHFTRRLETKWKTGT
ncbi:MAG TPA: RimK family protein [Acidobacteriota bacterium]|nr:RimK family protein [Acidobacteriota bacterium]HRR56262.1 RimK family protein [Acidobacteriota bacterium]HRV07279.1 RimK family protein [Acidobacteriota bacterium]